MNGQTHAGSDHEKIVLAFQTSSDMLGDRPASTGLPEQKDIDAIFRYQGLRLYAYFSGFMSMHRADPL